MVMGVDRAVHVANGSTVFEDLLRVQDPRRLGRVPEFMRSQAVAGVVITVAGARLKRADDALLRFDQRQGTQSLLWESEV